MIITTSSAGGGGSVESVTADGAHNQFFLLNGGDAVNRVINPNRLVKNLFCGASVLGELLVRDATPVNLLQGHVVKNGSLDIPSGNLGACNSLKIKTEFFTETLVDGDTFDFSVLFNSLLVTTNLFNPGPSGPNVAIEEGVYFTIETDIFFYSASSLLVKNTIEYPSPSNKNAYIKYHISDDAFGTLVEGFDFSAANTASSFLSFPDNLGTRLSVISSIMELNENIAP